MEEEMKRWKYILLPFAVFALALLACSLPTGASVGGKVDAVSTSAAQTVEALHTQTGKVKGMGSQIAATVESAVQDTVAANAPAVSTVKPTLNLPMARKVPQLSLLAVSSISGAIHHSGVASDFTLFWREVNTGKVNHKKVTKNETTYTISDLAPGDYNVISWYDPQGASGAVTTTNIITTNGAAQQQACKAGLRKIHVDAGQAVTGADIGCWGGDYFFLLTPAAP
jgi:hypothetical protein